MTPKLTIEIPPGISQDWTIQFKKLKDALEIVDEAVNGLSRCGIDITVKVTDLHVTPPNGGAWPNRLDIIND